MKKRKTLKKKSGERVKRKRKKSKKRMCIYKLLQEDFERYSEIYEALPDDIREIEV